MSKLLATSGDCLPPEITEAILTFVPANSLGRFKSVSKSWKSGISDPQFIKKHLLHRTELILCSNTRSLYSVDASEFFQCLDNNDTSVTVKEMANGQQPPTGWKEILGSCNGLVLAKDRNNKIYLVNPTTRELWEVPISSFTLPQVYPDLYGFWYDSSTDDYKVISISFCKHPPEGTDTFVSVYSLRNNSWRQLPNSPFSHKSREIVNGVLINQKFYWPATQSTVVAFSLADEEFTEIKLPDSFASHEVEFYYSLLDVGGKLGLSFGTSKCYVLWVMEESWTQVSFLKLNIDPDSAVCLVQGSKHIIVFHNEEEGGFVVYNIDERSCSNVRIAGASSGLTSPVCKYLETLESPRRITTPQLCV